MGCGASGAVPPPGEDPPTCDVTHIRDMTPAHVADTGAHPPAEKKVCFRRTQVPQLPGVVPEQLPGVVSEQQPDRAAGEGPGAKVSRSLIKMHPPRKPQFLLQRLEEERPTDAPPGLHTLQIADVSPTEE